MSKIRTRKELAAYYEVNIKTLTKWLKRERIVLPPGTLSPKFIKVIIDKLGNPENLK